jgi:hypothetical protein
MRTYPVPLRRLAGAVPTISVVLAVLGTLYFLTGSVAYHALGSVLSMCLILVTAALGVVITPTVLGLATRGRVPS